MWEGILFGHKKNCMIQSANDWEGDPVKRGSQQQKMVHINIITDLCCLRKMHCTDHESPKFKAVTYQCVLFIASIHRDGNREQIFSKNLSLFTQKEMGRLSSRAGGNESSEERGWQPTSVLSLLEQVDSPRANFPHGLWLRDNLHLFSSKTVSRLGECYKP